MTSKVLSAGDYTAAKCTKCKDTTNHTIVAMVGEAIVKVECNTCSSVHKYRGETKKKAPAQRKTSTAKPRTTKAQRAWEELQETLRPEDAIPYSMSTAMKVDMLIKHPSFGLGLVVNCIRPNKMEIQFESGVKLLRCKID